MSTAELVAIVASSQVVAQLASSLLTRRTNTFAVFTGAYEALAQRVTALETKLAEVEGKLGTERSDHERTRGLLRLAVGHIRAVVAWGAGDRSSPLPEPPRELMVRA